MKERLTYAEQLNHPLWKEKARWIRERDEFTCVRCGAEWKILHIHHISPEPNTLAWDYPNETLETLCEDCHAWETMYQRIFFRLTFGLGGWISPLQSSEYFRIKSLPKTEAFAIFKYMVKKNPLNDAVLLLKLQSMLRIDSESKPILTNHS